jgi:Fur family peroxide stress response transcriptional regulator
MENFTIVNQVCRIPLTLLIMIIIIELMDDTALPGKKKKRSRKRDEILKVIRSTGSHPSARWVYERLKPDFPRLSLGTVYRNIRGFQEEGELVSVGVVQGEERFDGRVQPHPHFICSRCGKIVDLDGDIAIEGDMDNTLGDATGAAAPELSPGLYVDHRKTVFYGLCGDCQKAGKEGITTV